MPHSYLERFGYRPALPTPTHLTAMEAMVDRLAGDERAQAVLLTCSCARGKAVAESCVDMVVLVAPEALADYRRTSLRAHWRFIEEHPACVALQQIVPWAGVELDAADGQYPIPHHHYTSGPDDYELAIGNTLAWVHPLLLRDPRFEALQAEHLPYYDEAQRTQRLGMVIGYARNNLEHVLPFARRDLMFQAFQRLYHALGEFLQALFIQRRLYPLAYDKWVKEQVAGVLGEPALYEELTAVLAVPTLCEATFAPRVATLYRLLDGLA
jgi:hypothetical protein